MMTLLKMSLISMYFILLKSLNPVKMSLILVYLSANLFFLMNLSSGKNWYTCLFMLLFMGGILIMFMILSSLMPNEKTKKMKFYIFSLFIVFTYSSISAFSIGSFNSSNMIKQLMTEEKYFCILMVFMIIYFFVFLKLMKSEKISMRNLNYSKI